MPTQRNAWLLRTDENGDTLWTRIYGGAYRDAGSDIVALPDGGFAFAGYTFSFSGEPGTRCDGWLVRLDSVGDTLWTRSFAGVYGSGGTFASVRLLADGGFLMGGTDNANDGEGWIVQTDSLGNLVWQDAWGDIVSRNWDHITCAQPTPDGGCIGFGCSYTYATPSFDAWMLRIDSVVNVGVGETPGAPRVEPGAGPTVVRGVLYGRRLPAASGVLLDATGRRLMEIRPGPNDIGHLASGVYFVIWPSAVSRQPSAAQRVVVQH